ncbi:MAG TPA: helix-turn-helix domain-containing protein [Firmicutes bacterium]|nr:helix-turn-helix domain-containing protein [Bacillota bacterium]HHY98339.1 helix-turn-helix domain-containing protein [Bacillota bacterium]
MGNSPINVDFADVINIKALVQFQRIFYQLTGLPVSVCNSDFESITFYPRAHRSQLCRLVQASPEGLGRCRDSDRRAVGKAIEKNRPHIYRCHAGLVNVAIPLIVEGDHVGNILTGQVLTEPPKSDAVDRFRDNLKGLRFNAAMLESAIGGLMIVPESKLRLASQLLSLLATYIMDTEILALVYKKKASEILGLSPPDGLAERLKRSEPFGARVGSARVGSNSHEEIIRQTERFIEENLKERITLADVARVVGLCPTYFARVFGEKMGVSFHLYLTQRRMQRAADLLKDSSLSIGEIAYNVGYPDQNHFSQVFKKMIGMSPSNYRKQLRDRALERS